MSQDRYYYDNNRVMAEDTVTEVRKLLNDLQKCFQCTICLDLLSQPTSTKCNHQFCRKCLDELVKKNNKKKPVACPLCKTNVTKRGLNHNKKLEGVVGAVRDVCNAADEDCGWLGRTPLLSQRHRPTKKSTVTKKKRKKVCFKMLILKFSLTFIQKDDSKVTNRSSTKSLIFDFLDEDEVVKEETRCDGSALKDDKETNSKSLHERATINLRKSKSKDEKVASTKRKKTVVTETAVRPNKKKRLHKQKSSPEFDATETYCNSENEFKTTQLHKEMKCKTFSREKKTSACQNGEENNHENADSVEEDIPPSVSTNATATPELPGVNRNYPHENENTILISDNAMQSNKDTTNITKDNGMEVDELTIHNTKITSMECETAATVETKQNSKIATKESTNNISNNKVNVKKSKITSMECETNYPDATVETKQNSKIAIKESTNNISNNKVNIKKSNEDLRKDSKPDSVCGGSESLFSEPQIQIPESEKEDLLTVNNVENVPQNREEDECETFVTPEKTNPDEMNEFVTIKKSSLLSFIHQLQSPNQDHQLFGNLALTKVPIAGRKKIRPPQTPRKILESMKSTKGSQTDTLLEKRGICVSGEKNDISTVSSCETTQNSGISSTNEKLKVSRKSKRAKRISRRSVDKSRIKNSIETSEVDDNNQNNSEKTINYAENKIQDVPIKHENKTFTNEKESCSFSEDLIPPTPQAPSKQKTLNRSERTITNSIVTLSETKKDISIKEKQTNAHNIFDENNKMTDDNDKTVDNSKLKTTSVEPIIIDSNVSTVGGKCAGQSGDFTCSDRLLYDEVNDNETNVNQDLQDGITCSDLNMMGGEAMKENDNGTKQTGKPTVNQSNEKELSADEKDVEGENELSADLIDDLEDNDAIEVYTNPKNNNNNNKDICDDEFSESIIGSNGISTCALAGDDARKQNHMEVDGDEVSCIDDDNDDNADDNEDDGTVDGNGIIIGRNGISTCASAQVEKPFLPNSNDICKENKIEDDMDGDEYDDCAEIDTVDNNIDKGRKFRQNFLKGLNKTTSENHEEEREGKKEITNDNLLSEIPSSKNIDFAISQPDILEIKTIDAAQKETSPVKKDESDELISYKNEPEKLNTKNSCMKKIVVENFDANVNEEEEEEEEEEIVHKTKRKHRMNDFLSDSSDHENENDVVVNPFEDSPDRIAEYNSDEDIVKIKEIQQKSLLKDTTPKLPLVQSKEKQKKRIERNQLAEELNKFVNDYDNNDENGETSSDEEMLKQTIFDLIQKKNKRHSTDKDMKNKESDKKVIPTKENDLDKDQPDIRKKKTNSQELVTKSIDATRVLEKPKSKNIELSPTTPSQLKPIPVSHSTTLRTAKTQFKKPNPPELLSINKADEQKSTVYNFKKQSEVKNVKSKPKEVVDLCETDADIETHTKPLPIKTLTRENTLHKQLTNISPKDKLIKKSSIERQSPHTTTSSTKVPTQVANKSSGPCILMSRLTKKQANVCAHICKRLGGTATSVYNENVTHLVLTTDENNSVSKFSYTYKFLLGLVAGLWMVNVKWIFDSEKVGKLLPEDRYEVKGDSTEQQTDMPTIYRKAVKSSSHYLFHGYRICLIGFFKKSQITKDQLVILLQKTGAELVYSVTEIHCSSSQIQTVLIADDLDDFTRAEKDFIQDYSLEAYHPDWVVNSIINFKIQDLCQYQLRTS